MFVTQLKMMTIFQSMVKSGKTKKPTAENNLWKIFSIFIRLRDAQIDTGLVRCFTCSAIKHWRDGDCGHGIGRQHKSTKFDEKNNHFQCKKCNGFEEGRKDVYSKNVDKRYGAGTWDWLQLTSRKTCHRGLFEFEILEVYYKNEIQRLLKEKHLVL
jgi:hypothetical protein